MYGLIREEGSLGASPSVKDLAQHLCTRMYNGKVVIVADRPVALLGPLRKVWLGLVRAAQKERAKTLDAAHIQELTGRITHMQALKFTASWRTGADSGSQHDVYLATADQLLLWPPDCRTMYVTCPVELEKLHRITSWMPPGSLVVVAKFSSS